MKVGKFINLLDQDKVDAVNRSKYCVKTYCAICGKVVNAYNYCFGCKCFICEDCFDSKNHFYKGHR